MGKHDSSLTRVVPLVDFLRTRFGTDGSWVRTVIHTAEFGRKVKLPEPLDIKEIMYGDGNAGNSTGEKKLSPPRSLLEWLIRNASAPQNGNWGTSEETISKRKSLVAGDESTVTEAIDSLAGWQGGADWFIFEGDTQPDLFVRTSEMVLVVEGKRTESEPTRRTTWMETRHQMLRHLDCALEAYPELAVIGMMIVEGEANGDVRGQYREYCEELLSDRVINGSLPHRSSSERERIAGGFAGVSTWQRICRELDVPEDVLLDYRK